MPGPPDKWVKFPVTATTTSDDVLKALNELALEGVSSAAVSVQCSDGLFMFVGGYSNQQG